MSDTTGFITLATLAWHPQLGPIACALLLTLLAAWCALLYRRMRQRMTRARAVLLSAPKLLALLMLTLALFDPAWSLTRELASTRRLLAVVDRSGSMETRDLDGTSRLERARALLAKMRSALGAGVEIATLEFDTALRDPAEKATPDSAARGTDLGGLLAALSRRADTSSHEAVILLTDGGDEAVESATLPPLPLHIVGIASDAESWNDVTLAGVRNPPSVEKDTVFEISVDLKAGGEAAFTAGLKGVAVTLEEQRDGAWTQAAPPQRADLSRRRATVRFNASSAATGIHRYRVQAAVTPGEMSALNNRRDVAVDVRRQALHVLYFTRELGASFKAVRNELAHDPGIEFTALYRTIGERFTLQGERRAGDEELEAGFPSDPAVLRLFDVVIVDSFPRDDWTAEQFRCLADYVDQGGAAVFLGGEAAFSPAFAATPLADLLPWHIEGGAAALLRGPFPVSVPNAARDHAILAGVAELLPATASLEAINDPGALKSGATALLLAGVGGRSLPVVAVMSYGRGRVLALASNTMWQWARGAPELPAAFGAFWRQAARFLGGGAEGDRYLSIHWDRTAYRPGERAVAEIRVAGGEQGVLRFAATLTHDAEAQQIAVNPSPDDSRAYLASLTFAQRGDYVFALTAYRADRKVESYERTIPVAPLLGEGAQLAVDHRFLGELATRGGGMYVREASFNDLVEHLRHSDPRRAAVIETSLVHGTPWFAVLFVALLVGEWIVRRRLNLF